MIVPNVVGRINMFKQLRRFILNNTFLYLLKQEGAPFVGVDMEMYSIFFKKIKKATYYIRILSHSDICQNTVCIDIFRKYNRFILWHDEMFDYLIKHSKLNLLTSHRGPDWDHKANKDTKFKFPFLYSHGSVDKYHIRNFEFTDRNTSQNAVLISSRNRYRIYRCVINPGFYVGAGIAIIKFKEVSKNKDVNNVYKNLLLILNSKLMDVVILKYVFNYDTKPSNLQEDVLNFTPIRMFVDKNIILCADYLLFLNATEERREKLKEIIEFFDRQIADSLVYELYFKEKFVEGSIIISVYFLKILTNKGKWLILS